MSTDREETIRYNAGLAEQLRNTIRKIDGVLDADVQISFPPAETTPGAPPQKTTAAVYVKHQGVLEDPNSHIETKIKRLLAGSINGLEYDNVSVISDRSRFADISLEPEQEADQRQKLSADLCEHLVDRHDERLARPLPDAFLLTDRPHFDPERRGGLAGLSVLSADFLKKKSEETPPFHK